MKENVDKHLDEFVDKVMKQSSLETPSFDFTSAVMGKVDAIKAKATLTYEPLISKRVWFVILGGFVALVVYLIWIGKLENSGWFNAIDFSFFSLGKSSELFNGIKLSGTTYASVLIFAIMLLIQIPLLKYYFNKRMQF